MENFTITNTNHKNLDGLRAIGILMVMIQHFYGELINVSVFWVSIDLLFALSGLLITGILIETKQDRHYFKKFYARRILRIFPLYYFLILLFSIFVFCITKHSNSFSYFKSNIGYFLTYTQNWYFIKAGLPKEGHLNHTWSLAIDEQIYIFWPLLIWLCKNKKQLLTLCVCTLLFSLFFRLIYNSYNGTNGIHPCPFFHHTLCRIDSFAAGSLLYCLIRFKSTWLTPKNMILIFIVTLIIFSVLGILDNSYERYGYFMRNIGITIIGVHFTTWLYFAIIKSGKILNRILGSRFLIYIGKISYSLYVYHWFLLILLAAKINNLLNNYLHINSLLLASTFCFCITFFVSILSYHFLEKPIIRIKKRFSYKT